VLQIDQSSNGGEVEVGLGESFEVRLPENPTTGYRWRLRDSAGPALEVQEDSFQPFSNRIGAGGTRRWRIMATREGVARLEMDCKRSSGQHAVDSFAVTVRVPPP
jgi:inhibitor of cysteine peptidase